MMEDKLIYYVSEEPQHFTRVSFYLKQKTNEVGEHIIKEIIKDAFGGYVSFDPSGIRIENL